MGRRSRWRGFTLVELLVVIAILGALMAILLPSLAAGKERTRRVQCCANLRSLAQCDAIYGMEYGAVSRDSGLINGQIFPTVFWLLATDQRMPLPFPSTPAESEFAESYRKIGWLKCPAFPRSDQVVSFVVNAFDPDNPGAKLAYLRATRIVRPAETCNFTEANFNIPRDVFDLYDVWQTGHIQPNPSTPVTADSPAGRISSDDRHGKLINMSFYDGHVEPRKIEMIAMRDFINH